MDSTNNQIYKIAKYLDKYTKDGNKNNDVYLQKLNNYLHKVQHGGQAMDIVEQIQGMVGQVIGMHQREGYTLTTKLQELGGKHKLGQLVTYESVVQELRKKIENAATSAPVPTLVAPVSQQSELTFEKIKNMTLTDFATIALNRAGINSVKAKNGVIELLEKSTFQEFITDKVRPNFKGISHFVFSPNNIEPIVNALIIMRAEIEAECEKSSEGVPVTFINIFKKKDSTPAPVSAPAPSAPAPAPVSAPVSAPALVSAPAPAPVALVAPYAPVSQQSELTPEKIQNMTLKGFATIAVDHADIKEDRLDIIKNVKTVLKELNFEDLNHDNLLTKLKENKELQSHIGVFEPIVNALVKTKNMFETQYRKTNATGPTGPLKYIFKKKFQFELITLDEYGEIIHSINSINKEELKKILQIPTLELEFSGTPFLYFYVTRAREGNRKDQYLKLATDVDRKINDKDIQIDVEISKEGPVSKQRILILLIGVPELLGSVKEKKRKIQEEIKEKKQEQQRIKEQEKQKLIQEWEDNENMFKRFKENEEVKQVVTDKFDVIGYIVNEDETLEDTFSEFIHKKEKKEEKEEKEEKEKKEEPLVFLNDKYRNFLLDKLGLKDKLSISKPGEKSDQYKLTGAGIRIVLQESTNILQLLDRINDTETYIDLSDSQGKNIRVRLFIKPTTYSIKDPSAEDAAKLKSINLIVTIVNKKIISIKIEKKFMLPQRLMTDTFEVLGYIVNSDGTLTEYKFPHNVPKGAKNSLLHKDINLVDALKIPIALLPRNPSFEITNEGIRIVLTTQINIRELVNRINNAETYIDLSDSQGESIRVRLFIKPLQKSTKELDGFNKKYQQKVNELSVTISQEIQAKAPLDLSEQRLTTDHFYILGYNMDDTGILGSIYFFPTEQKQSKSYLIEEYRNHIISIIGLGSIENVSIDRSFQVTKSGMMLIVLKEKKNIMEYVAFVNSGRFARLPTSQSQENVSVRLFIKPMSYNPTKNKKEEAINTLERKIEESILHIVKQSKIERQNASSAPKQPAQQLQPASSAPKLSQPVQSRQQVQLDSSNPTTDEFDVVGFYIDRDKKIQQFRIPPQRSYQEQVLDLFNKSDPPIYNKIKELNSNKFIEFIDEEKPEGSEEKSEGKKVRNKNKARITFTQQLPIRTTLVSVNKHEPLEPVSFEITSNDGKKSTFSVYMFIVPVTYPITSDTTATLKTYHEAINAIHAEEMKKINDRMEEIAQEQRRQGQRQGQRQGRQPVRSLAQQPASKLTQGQSALQPQQPDQSQVQQQSTQPQVSAPTRGRGGRGGGI
jgi:hypothetical protein